MPARQRDSEAFRILENANPAGVWRPVFHPRLTFAPDAGASVSFDLRGNPFFDELTVYWERGRGWRWNARAEDPEDDMQGHFRSLPNNVPPPILRGAVFDLVAKLRPTV